jgi:hypothetical protein
MRSKAIKKPIKPKKLGVELKVQIWCTVALGIIAIIGIVISFRQVIKKIDDVIVNIESIENAFVIAGNEGTINVVVAARGDSDELSHEPSAQSTNSSPIEIISDYYVTSENKVNIYVADKRLKIYEEATNNNLVHVYKANDTNVFRFDAPNKNDIETLRFAFSSLHSDMKNFREIHLSGVSPDDILQVTMIDLMTFLPKNEEFRRGFVYELTTQAKMRNGIYTNEKVYRIMIDDDIAYAPEITVRADNVDSVSVYNSLTYINRQTRRIYITVKHRAGIEYVRYYFGGTAPVTLKVNPKTTILSFDINLSAYDLEPNEIHNLYISALASSTESTTDHRDNVGGWSFYSFFLEG